MQPRLVGPPGQPDLCGAAPVQSAAQYRLVEYVSPELRINQDELARVCQRWKVSELALFGSVVRSDFGPDSDVDVLVSFNPDAGHSLFDLIDLQEALERLFGRKVDLVERRALRNPFVLHEVARTARVVYAA